MSVFGGFGALLYAVYVISSLEVIKMTCTPKHTCLIDQDSLSEDKACLIIV
jgi:hypothetical protein